jgi:hypothetical protein
MRRKRYADGSGRALRWSRAIDRLATRVEDQPYEMLELSASAHGAGQGEEDTTPLVVNLPRIDRRGEVRRGRCVQHFWERWEVGFGFGASLGTYCKRSASHFTGSLLWSHEIRKPLILGNMNCHLHDQAVTVHLLDSLRWQIRNRGRNIANSSGGLGRSNGNFFLLLNSEYQGLISCSSSILICTVQETRLLAWYGSAHERTQERIQSSGPTPQLQD